MKIPFNKPAVLGSEIKYIRQTVRSLKISGDGEFTKECSKLIETKFAVNKVLLTTSCTHALEMAALLLDIKRGDEVIVPSYTFSSTVNAFLLRGAKPVFCDIRGDTLNIDEKNIRDKITKRTKAIVPVHYAGVGCEMDYIKDIAEENNLKVVEDAAQAVNAKYNGRYLGTIGDLGAYSFHETKNYACGEGGALLINDDRYVERAEIIREKGTDRSRFYRGEVDKYTWVDIGSSYLPSEILSAFLLAQLENKDKIQNMRGAVFSHYMKSLKKYQKNGLLRLPVIPKQCRTNYHMFYVLLPNEKFRDTLLRELNSQGIHAVIHYLPLHSSPMGLKLGYHTGDFPISEEVSQRIIRLPLYAGLKDEDFEYIIETIGEKLEALE